GEDPAADRPDHGVGRPTGLTNCGLRLGAAILGRHGGKEAREIAPAIGDGLDHGPTNGERPVAHPPSAQPPAKKTRRVVAQDPDNSRGATHRDKASEEGDHETPADAKILPIRPDIKREDLARKKAVATVWATAAKTENNPVIRHRNANVSRLAQ